MSRDFTFNTSGSTSSSLLGRVRQQDPEAWRRLTQIYGPLVYRWARRAGLDDSDAADIGQEVFRTVAARFSSFDHRQDGGSFRGWLWTITRNKIGNHLQRHSRREQAAGGTEAWQRLEQVAHELPSEDLDAGDNEVESKLMQRALQLIKTDFEDRTWLAFWRAAIDEHSPSTIAQDLGMTPKAVRQAKHRVLRRLRDELDQLFDEFS